MSKIFKAIYNDETRRIDATSIQSFQQLNEAIEKSFQLKDFK